MSKLLKESSYKGAKNIDELKQYPMYGIFNLNLKKFEGYNSSFLSLEYFNSLYKTYYFILANKNSIINFINDEYDYDLSAELKLEFPKVFYYQLVLLLENCSIKVDENKNRLIDKNLEAISKRIKEVYFLDFISVFKMGYPLWNEHYYETDIFINPLDPVGSNLYTDREREFNLAIIDHIKTVYNRELLTFTNSKYHNPDHGIITFLNILYEALEIIKLKGQKLNSFIKYLIEPSPAPYYPSSLIETIRPADFLYWLLIALRDKISLDKIKDTEQQQLYFYLFDHAFKAIKSESKIAGYDLSFDPTHNFSNQKSYSQNIVQLEKQPIHFEAEEILPNTPAEPTENKLSLNQIALIQYYEGRVLNRETAPKIVKQYGWASGDALYKKFSYYSTRANRRAITDTDVTMLNKVKLFESVIPLLSDSAQKKAEDDLKHLMDQFEKLYCK